MLQNAPEFNSVGGGFGGFGGFGGGIGGLGLVGLVGLNNLFDRDLGRKDDCGGPGVNELATLQAISNAKDTTVAEGRVLGASICESEKTSLQQFYAAAIQASSNTQAIKDQATAFAIYLSFGSFGGGLDPPKSSANVCKFSSFFFCKNFLSNPSANSLPPNPIAKAPKALGVNPVNSKEKRIKTNVIKIPVSN